MIHFIHSSMGMTSMGMTFLPKASKMVLKMWTKFTGMLPAMSYAQLQAVYMAVVNIVGFCYDNTCLWKQSIKLPTRTWQSQWYTWNILWNMSLSNFSPRQILGASLNFYIPVIFTQSNKQGNVILTDSEMVFGQEEENGFGKPLEFMNKRGIY